MQQDDDGRAGKGVRGLKASLTLCQVSAGEQSHEISDCVLSYSMTYKAPSECSIFFLCTFAEALIQVYVYVADSMAQTDGTLPGPWTLRCQRSCSCSSKCLCGQADRWAVMRLGAVEMSFAQMDFNLIRICAQLGNSPAFLLPDSCPQDPTLSDHQGKVRRLHAVKLKPKP